MYASAQPPPCAAYPVSAPPALFILPGDDDNGDDEDSEGLEDVAQSYHTPASSTQNMPQLTVSTSSPHDVESPVQLCDAYLGARYR